MTIEESTLSRKSIEESIANLRRQQSPGSSPIAAAIETIAAAYAEGYTPAQIADQIARDTGQSVRKETIARYVRAYKARRRQQQSEGDVSGEKTQGST